MEEIDEDSEVLRILTTVKFLVQFQCQSRSLWGGACTLEHFVVLLFKYSSYFTNLVGK